MYTISVLAGGVAGSCSCGHWFTPSRGRGPGRGWSPARARRVGCQSDTCTRRLLSCTGTRDTRGTRWPADLGAGQEGGAVDEGGGAGAALPQRLLGATQRPVAGHVSCSQQQCGEGGGTRAASPVDILASPCCPLPRPRPNNFLLAYLFICDIPVPPVPVPVPVFHQYKLK